MTRIRRFLKPVSKLKKNTASMPTSQPNPMTTNDPNPALKHSVCAIVALMGVVLCFVSGCSVPGSNLGGAQHFVLGAERSGSAAEGIDKGVLRIRSFRISSPFSSNQLVYRTGKVSYEADYYKRFLVPPGSMITEQLQNWLIDSGVFRNVVGASSRVESDYSMEGRIFGIYGDYRDPRHPWAMMGMQIIIVDEADAANSVRFNKTYNQALPVPSISAADLVVGFNKCLENIFTELEKDLRQMNSE